MELKVEKEPQAEKYYIQGDISKEWQEHQKKFHNGELCWFDQRLQPKEKR